MTASSCLKARLPAMIMAGLIAAPALAQTPPRPTFNLTQQPTLYYNVWPADFNRDGVTDLVAGTRAPGFSDPGDVVVALGRGNGTFLDPVPVAYRGLPLLPADFNADGFVDVVILRGRSLEVLAGNGDGTFDTAVPIDDNVQLRELRFWAFSADMNGDGRRDLIVPDFDGDYVLKLYPGTGTFAFGPPIVLQTASNLPPSEISSGDFNGDGRRDFVLVNLCCDISIYMNQGNNTFTRTDLPGAYNDVTVADLNVDGKLDLISVTGRYDNFTSIQPLGAVVVRLGNGNGTFRPAVTYSTGVRGATSVVVGDFNGDARADVATGNRSVIADDDLGGHLSDSVSILPGDGTGRLLAPTTYALAYLRQNDIGVSVDVTSPYWGANHQLNTSDLDGDHRTDLITSPGVTLLNRPARVNRVPSVFAGPTHTEFENEQSVNLAADASDPDMDWLTYRWTDVSGRILSTVPFVRIFVEPGARHTFTVTVDDGHGGVARSSVTVRNADGNAEPALFLIKPMLGENIQAGVPYTIRWDVVRGESIASYQVVYSRDDGRTFTVVPGCGTLGAAVRECTWNNPGPLTDRGRIRVVGRAQTENWILLSRRFSILADPILPIGWSSADIGAVAARGRAAVDDGTWTVEGSGADIWSTADEFRYVYVPTGPQFTFTARVASIENLDQWVKAGIMVREDLAPGSRHVSLFATPRTTRGLAFQRRVQPGGLTVHTAGPAIAPPMWLRVGRSGDKVSAYYRLSPSQPWILVGRQTVPQLRNDLYVGLAVTSHVDGTLATATFDNVTHERGNPLIKTEDVGAVGVPGSTTFDGVVYELQGSGADVWNNVDSFHFAYSSGYFAYGNIASISARVRSVENTNAWAKAGVMYRELIGSGPSAPPDGRHVMVAVTPGRGVVMQYRGTAGGQSKQVAARAGVAPAFVSLTRSGNTFTGWTSKDGVTWQRLGEVTLDMFADPGLFVTSVNNATLATATFDDLRLILF